MPTTFRNAETTNNERTGLGPTSKFNMSDAEVGLAATTIDIQQSLEAYEHDEPAPLSNNIELASDQPADIGLEQPRPVKRALFKDALYRIEKVIQPTDSEGEPQRESHLDDIDSSSKEGDSSVACAGQETFAPRPLVAAEENIFRRGIRPDSPETSIDMPPFEEMSDDDDLSNNVFWRAYQRQAEQPLVDACSTEKSSSGDASRTPSSPRPAPRTPPPEPERTPTPLRTPYPIRKTRLIMQMIEKFGPDWNPIETEYGCPPSDSDSETDWDDDGVKDPYGVRTMRDFATENSYLDRSKSCPPCFSCDCAEAKAAKLRLAGKVELEEYERAPYWWWRVWCDTDRVIRRDF